MNTIVILPCGCLADIEACAGSVLGRVFCQQCAAVFPLDAILRWLQENREEIVMTIQIRLTATFPLLKIGEKVLEVIARCPCGSFVARDPKNIRERLHTRESGTRLFD